MGELNVSLDQDLQQTLKISFLVIFLFFFYMTLFNHDHK